MGYTMLKHSGGNNHHAPYSLEGAALAFIRDCCEDLRFSSQKAEEEKEQGYLGSSLHEKEIPYNMQMDIDRLCLENALNRFLESGKKEDAFDVYFCYLEMFAGEYEKTRRMIELLSEFEANGSRLLMKHRDHYSHSVYVFALGLAIYQTNSFYRRTYMNFYGLQDVHRAACHYLQYWGLASLFHDIGYPFELPFEQVASYFEVDGQKRENCSYVAYHALDSFINISESANMQLKALFNGRTFHTTDELFAHALFQQENRKSGKKLSAVYRFDEETMLENLRNRPIAPDQFNYFMDHAYFSATVLFSKLFCEMECELHAEHIDALTAILMHNSLYKFEIAHYKSKNNIPFQAELHPLAYMLMLCDELQCWDRTAYGRNSRTELHPMGCRFRLDGNSIEAVYLYDEKENGKIRCYQQANAKWLSENQDREISRTTSSRPPELKAYSDMFVPDSKGISKFQKGLERIVDLSEIRLEVKTKLCANTHAKSLGYLSNSNFIHLYNFAMVLNGRWENDDWRKAKEAGREEQFIADPDNRNRFADSFRRLSLEYKLSNINQAKSFARYMDEIGCFYSDKEVDFELVEHFSDEELVKIGRLEHRRWLQEHYDMGWEYGTPPRAERELVRQHNDMIPGFDTGQKSVPAELADANYERLSKAEQDKDIHPMECMLAMLRMFDGLRIYRLR